MRPEKVGERLRGMRARAYAAVLILAAAAALGQAAGVLPVLGEPLAMARGAQTATRQLSAASAVHEYRTADGGTVRAFTNASGAVFGIAWQTPTAPNLSQMLGQRFEAFQKAAANQRRGPLYVHTGDLVVESSGHMRDFRGRAYLAGMIPAGASPAVVH